MCGDIMPSVIIRGMGRSGEQVFKGKTESELIDKLAYAQRCGTKKIRELTLTIKALTALILESGKSSAWLLRALEQKLKELNSAVQVR